LDKLTNPPGWIKGEDDDATADRYVWRIGTDKLPSTPLTLYAKVNNPGEKIVTWALLDKHNEELLKDTIKLLPPNVVGVAGDTHAVEDPNTDDINLRMERICGNLDEALTVRFQLDWGNNLTVDDLTTPTNCTHVSGEIYTIDIPSGQNTSATITMAAIADGVMEGLENDAWATVLPPVSGNDYLVTKNHVEVKPKTAQTAFTTLRLSVMDSLTLYGPENDAPNGVLDDNNDPGIHWNDVQQMTLGDCSFLAAVMAMADHNGQSAGRAYIENSLISPVANGFEVNLFELNGDEDKQFVDMTELFTNGANMAQPTADYKLEGNGPLTVKLTEVWPIVVEKAYAQARGGYGNISTNPADAWKRLTGESGSSVSTKNMKNSEILQTIKSARSQGKIVCVSTQTSIDRQKRAKYSYNLAGHHAYYVPSLPSNNKLTLLNPWGFDRTVELDLGDLSNKIIACVYVLDPK
jgi:hypothetical protein